MRALYSEKPGVRLQLVHNSYPSYSRESSNSINSPRRRFSAL
jgi:hypothetical protein